jgi:predicted permease
MISSFELFKSTYSVLGMMIVGMGLAGIQKTSFDLKFILASFTSKFIFWPIVVGLIVWADLAFFHIFNQEIHKVMLIMAIIPMAADTVVFSTKFNIHPEKASLTVMLSTLFTLIYIPIFTSLFIQ